MTLGGQVFKASISYSKNSETYWGYTEVIRVNKGDKQGFVSLEISDFNPDDEIIVIREISNDLVLEQRIPIDFKRKGKLVESRDKEKSDLWMKREN